MKIPKKIPEEEAKKLCEIIKNIGLIIREEVIQKHRYVKDGYTYIDYYDAPGYVNRKEFCAYLGYKFDNMGETFVHECLHLKFPERNEIKGKKTQSYTPSDLFNPIINIKIGSWYLHDRIGKVYIPCYDLKDTPENKLACYKFRNI